jgi:hypothetical protein
LRQVGRIAVLEPAPACHFIHQRGVDLHELPPGLPIAVIPDPDQQARSRGVGLVHEVQISCQYIPAPDEDLSALEIRRRNYDAIRHALG